MDDTDCDRRDVALCEGESGEMESNQDSLRVTVVVGMTECVVEKELVSETVFVRVTSAVWVSVGVSVWDKVNVREMSDVREKVLLSVFEAMGVGEGDSVSDRCGVGVAPESETDSDGLMEDERIGVRVTLSVATEEILKDGVKLAVGVGLMDRDSDAVSVAEGSDVNVAEKDSDTETLSVPENS